MKSCDKHGYLDTSPDAKGCPTCRVLAVQLELDYYEPGEPRPSCTVTVDFPSCPHEAVAYGQACCHVCQPFHIFNFDVATRKGLVECAARHVLKLQCPRCGATAATLPEGSMDQINVVFSFDTTGSMYPCLAEVRNRVKETVTQLLKEVPGLKIGIIAHGDYCDKDSTYVTKIFDFSDKAADICKFVTNVEATGGGDCPECYELVLHQARSLSWTPGAKERVLVMIGDDVPHKANEAQNYLKLDWKQELVALVKEKVHVYAVQALGRRHATAFYTEIARATAGLKLDLNQFNQIVDLIRAICYKLQGPESLAEFEQQLIDEKRFNRGLCAIMDTLAGRKKSTFTGTSAAPGLTPVHPARFQRLKVVGAKPADKKIAIKQFVLSTGAAFKTGRGFYEFTKSEEVQETKEVVLVDRVTGDMFTGTEARDIIGVPWGTRGRVRPTMLDKWQIFIQSTSYNRALLVGTDFLYEVEDWDRVAAAA